MKYVVIAALIISLTAFKKPVGNDRDKIVGKWIASEDKNLIVQIFKAGEEFKAVVVWFDDSDDKSRPMNTRCDTKNSDKDQRCRKLIGLEVLRGLSYNTENNEWQNGHIYDPSSGKEYNAKAWIADDGCLKVRGFWHFEIFGQTMCFKKI